jgi:hypothetical protein
MFKSGLQLLDNLGYQKIDFLGTDEIKTLVQFYDNHNSRRNDYDSTYAEFSVLDADPSIRKDIFDFVVSMFMPKIDKILPGYKPVLANYVVKEVNGGIVPLHQNWSLVDETKYASYSVWVPLTPTNRDNGTLEFIPSTHINFRGPRGGRGHMPFSKIESKLLKRYSDIVDVQLGEAIILDDSVLHYSRSNYSNHKRIAVQLIIVPKEAEIIYYNIEDYSKKSRCKAYTVDPVFFQNMVYWKGNFDNYTVNHEFDFEYKDINFLEYLYRQFLKPKLFNIK